jgi:hypothetical protein
MECCKKMHIAEFEKRVAELREQLEKTARKHRAEERLQRPCEQSQKQLWNGVEHNVAMLIHAMVKKVEDAVQRHRELHVTSQSPHICGIQRARLLRWRTHALGTWHRARAELPPLCSRAPPPAATGSVPRQRAVCRNTGIWLQNFDFMCALVVCSRAGGLQLLQVVDDDGLCAE